MLFPRRDSPLRLHGLTEDESDEDVEASNREQEKGRGKCKTIDVMGENSGAQKHLEQAKSTHPKVISKNRKEAIKQLGRESELGKDEDDSLEYDKKPV